METTINNNLRVYQVITSTGRQIFCNIKELNAACKYLDTVPNYFKIYHFWNNKPEKLSKIKLDAMFEGSGIKREFEY